MNVSNKLFLIVFSALLASASFADQGATGVGDKDQADTDPPQTVQTAAVCPSAVTYDFIGRQPAVQTDSEYRPGHMSF
ncbi:hypothetical protein K2X33_06070 [bacterium]|nr:hypothetical protein [bacterium]